MMVSVKVSSGGSCTGDGRPQEDSLKDKRFDQVQNEPCGGDWRW